MKIKSEKYRELLEEERRLRNKLMHCEISFEDLFDVEVK